MAKPTSPRTPKLDFRNFLEQLPRWLRFVLSWWWAVVVLVGSSYIIGGLVVLVQHGWDSTVAYFTSFALLAPFVKDYPIPFYAVLTLIIVLAPISFSIERYERERALYHRVQKGLAITISSGLSTSNKVETVDLRRDWGEAPQLGEFYGREIELANLEQWIVHDHCRVVAVVGTGGIGKTALSAKLVEQVKQEFNYVFWRTLQNSPPFEHVLQQCIQFLSDQEQIQLPKDADTQISLLLKYLQDYRCLLILDNVEAIMQSGHLTGSYQDGYEGYGRLFERVGEVAHSSTLLLTSRQKPKEVVLLEGNTLPVRSLHLPGLEHTEAKAILKDKEVFGSTESQEALIHLYSGNPLALQLVSGVIHEVFGGDVAEFLKRNEAVFGDIYDLLEHQFSPLSGIEQEIMYWLAIEREAVSIDDLQEDLVRSVSTGEILEALQSLLHRSMIERSSSGLFFLQPVIIEYVTDRFVKLVCDELAGIVNLFESHALIKARAKDYVRQSQIRVILKPIVDRLLSNRAQVGIENDLKQILSSIRESHPQIRNYAAGNTLNLLIHMGSDLSSYDFSYLAIWQAYLRGVNLHDVNFAHCHFGMSVFTETFGSILSVDFSPTGQLMAAGTTNGEIRIWQATNGTPLLTYQGHSNWVWAVAFSPDGKLLASGSEDQMVRLWDISTRQCLGILPGHAKWVSSVAFSPDGRVLASGGDDQTVRLWNVSTGRCRNILHGHSNWIWSLAFSPDGRLLASGSNDQTVRLWDVGTARCLTTLHGHSNRVKSVAFSPDGKLLASGSDDGTIMFWDIEVGKSLTTLRADRPYERMNITSVIGLTQSQKVILRALGAITD